jgi:hypothetical protein
MMNEDSGSSFTIHGTAVFLKGIALGYFFFLLSRKVELVCFVFGYGRPCVSCMAGVMVV